MKLLEYEAKALLLKYNLPIPAGQLVRHSNDNPTIPLPLVIKVQIPVGGRGKAGGVKHISTLNEFHHATELLLSKPILGHQAHSLLAEQALDIKDELYIAITVDRTTRSLMLLAQKHGGMDIESAPHQSGMLALPLSGEPTSRIYEALFNYYGLHKELNHTIQTICYGLWDVCVNEDAMLVEVNPLVITTDNKVVCADAKIELDDAAAFRHPDRQFEQVPDSTQFVILDEQGTVGSMANGAGLAMATVDAIQASGVSPANFLDVGGGTNTDGMVNSFRKLSGLPNIRAIVVNIFGGITRCDEVADAIIKARESVPNLPPLFIRLTGTNEQQGRDLLENAGVSIMPDLKSCVDAAAKEMA